MIGVSGRQEKKFVDFVTRLIDENDLLTKFLSIVKATHNASKAKKLRFAAIEKMLSSKEQIEFYYAESDGLNAEDKAKILATCIPIFEMIGIKKKQPIINKQLFDGKIKPLLDQCESSGYSMTSLSVMMKGKTLPDPFKVENLWQQCLIFAEQEKDVARRIFSSITGMMTRKGLPNVDMVRNLWQQCLEFAGQEKNVARKIFSSITGMMGGKGLPNVDMVRNLWQKCLEFAGQDHKTAVEIFSSITGMMHQKGLPDSKTINHINNLWNWANIGELSASEKASLFGMATQCFKVKGNNFLKDFETQKEAGNCDDLYSAKLVFAVAYKRGATNIGEAMLAIAELKRLCDEGAEKNTIKINEIKSLITLKKDSQTESADSDQLNKEYENLYTLISKRKRFEVLFARENIVALLEQEKEFYDKLDPISKLEFIGLSVGAFLTEFGKKLNSHESTGVNHANDNQQNADMADQSGVNHYGSGLSCGLADCLPVFSEEFTLPEPRTYPNTTGFDPLEAFYKLTDPCLTKEFGGEFDIDEFDEKFDIDEKEDTEKTTSCHPRKRTSDDPDDLNPHKKPKPDTKKRSSEKLEQGQEIPKR